jgi:hypothetical protein
MMGGRRREKKRSEENSIARCTPKYFCLKMRNYVKNKAN